ncbi:MAG: Trm112 family protein [Desulfovibrionaceae bacterium]|nr:Trm112 family protein [Desulfovibrionaceae bacterium]
MNILNLLNCPDCGCALRVMDSHTGLVCPSCRLVYPIRDDVPFLIREEAVPLSAWTHGARALPGLAGSPPGQPAW